jgi:hypothetical protein
MVQTFSIIPDGIYVARQGIHIHRINAEKINKSP